ncbi:tetratricopeptide repeat-containing sensor histidine kinase [Tenuifilum thalassicum]|uniref:histidine kinase n=1 Tax=Tenuifilum thalassicum TaxID=2590900 RepID=A0A7D4CG51_9BACT|nr:ATP-binding protein [Tenuifilum thalassicum]QKG79586.1 tetratricopeptide repeat protein [Tenuifilum thalassicum]
MFRLLIKLGLTISLILNATLFSVAQQSTSKVDEWVSLAVKYEKEGNPNNAAFYYNKVANEYWNKRELKLASEYFNKALENIRKVGNARGEYVVLNNLGFISTDLQEYDNALNSFNKALDIARTQGERVNICQTYLNISNIYIEKGSFADAIKILDKAQTIAQEVNNPKLLRNIYYNYNKSYEGLKNNEKSTEYFNLYAVLTKKIQVEEARLRELQAKAMVDSAGKVVEKVSKEKEQTVKILSETASELKEKEQELKKVEKLTKEQQMQIDLLNAEMKLRDAIIENQRLLQRIYIIIILFSLALLGVLYYAYIQKRRANRLLEEKNSEISRQRDALSRQADELRELNALKDKLFSIIAHDLRSPLFSLITMLNIAREGHFTAENFRQILDELSVNVNHTTALLENLLTWAKNQMHGTKVNPINFEVNELVESKIQLLHDAAETKEIKLINSIPHGTFVFADKDMTDIVIRNLISNAIKFCSSGDKINVWSFTGGSVVTICVEDTGLGMTEDIKNKLFGTQISSTPGTNNEKGTGLGLILCKEFVEMNGGEIWAESEPGKGSKFYFTLPVATVDA